MISTHPRPWPLPLLLLLVVGCGAKAPDGSNAVPARSTKGNAALAKSLDVPEAVRQLTARGSETREVTEGATPGSRVVRVREGNAEVLVARANPDGTVSTRCVDSAEGAKAFLEEAPVAAANQRAAQ